jgi:GntR family transcriptional regulator
MLFFLDPQSGVPYYRQLMEQVRLHVSAGTLKAGDELPSIRALAVTLGVNPMTVSKAYGYLEAERMLERRPGRPLVVRAQTQRQLDLGRLDRLREGLRDSVNLSLRLDIAADDALGVFRELLEDAERGGAREEDPS